MDMFRNIRPDGVLLVDNAAERVALIPSDGFLVEDTDTNTLWAWNATSQSWVLLTGGGFAGVTDVNGASGSITLDQGTNITIVQGPPGTFTVNSTGGGSGTPALPFNSIQYNNAGAFGGSADFTYDGTNAQLATSGTFIVQDLAFRPFLDINTGGTCTMGPLFDGIYVQTTVSNGGEIILSAPGNPGTVAGVQVSNDLALTSPGKFLLSSPTDYNWFINREPDPVFSRHVTGNGGFANTINTVMAAATGEGLAVGLNTGGNALFELTGNDNTGGGVYSAWFEVDAFQVNVSNAYAAIGDVLNSFNHTIVTIDDSASAITAQATNSFIVQDPSAKQYITVSMPSQQVYLITPNGVSAMGDVHNTNAHTNFSVNDATETITAQVDSAFIVQLQSGTQWLNVGPNTSMISYGDISTSQNSTINTLNDTTASFQSSGLMNNITPPVFSGGGGDLNDLLPTSSGLVPGSVSYTVTVGITGYFYLVAPPTTGTISPGDSYTQTATGAFGTVFSVATDIVLLPGGGSPQVNVLTVINDTTSGGTITPAVGYNVDAFSWSDSNANTGSGYMSELPQALSYNISTAWFYTFGHTTGDNWTFTANRVPGRQLLIDYAAQSVQIGDVDSLGNLVQIDINQPAGAISAKVVTQFSAFKQIDPNAVASSIVGPIIVPGLFGQMDGAFDTIYNSLSGNFAFTGCGDLVNIGLSTEAVVMGHVASNGDSAYLIADTLLNSPIVFLNCYLNIDPLGGFVMVQGPGGMQYQDNSGNISFAIAGSGGSGYSAQIGPNATGNSTNISLNDGAQTVQFNNVIHTNMPLATYANNAAAVAGGLNTGDFYQTVVAGDGIVKIVQ